MVIILDKHKKPLGFTTERRANKLLKDNKAIIHSLFPFVIRHKTLTVTDCTKLEYKVKIDPGSKYTGIAITDLNNNAYLFAVITHRGEVVVHNLASRNSIRRSRRNRKTRYRRCKFINRKLKKGSKYRATTDRPKGWLPPSIVSIEQNIINFIKKMSKLINIVECSIENVKFDTQLLDNPNISGVEYQQGTLYGYEIREYLLEKYNHKCQYCGGESKDTILELEHIISKYNGGTNKISNLTIACHTCNQEKDNLNLDAWLKVLAAKKKPSLLDQERIKNITNFLVGKPLVKKNYASYVNSYRYKLIKDVKNLKNIRKIEYGTGGKTKFNRTNQKLPKEHYYDALCIGNIPTTFKIKTKEVYDIKAMGRGSRLKGKPNKCGILSKTNIKRAKSCEGFQTGDFIKAIVTKGKKIGTYVGRVAIRHSGYFNISTKTNLIQGISYKCCTILQRGNGYDYKLIQCN